MSDTDALGIEELADIRRAAKALWESGLLEPHEKEHQLVASISSRLRPRPDSSVGPARRGWGRYRPGPRR